MGHILHWTPGTYGKGIVTPEGDVHTWNTDPRTEDPHHQEYIIDQLGVPEEGLSIRNYRPFEITPEGYYLPVHESPGDLEKIDPRLKYNGSRWNFESSENAHSLNWIPGQWGKGLIHNGNVHTWNTNFHDGPPTHPRYAEDYLGMDMEDWLGSPAYESAFVINPKGDTGFYDYNFPHQSRDLVQKVDPRLRLSDDFDNAFDANWTWKFQATSNIKVIRVPTGPNKEGAEIHGNRQPIFYDPNKKHLYVGDPGSTHWELENSSDDPKAIQKIIDEGGMFYGGLYHDPRGQKIVEIYDDIPYNHPTVDQHMKDISQALDANKIQTNIWHIGQEPDRDPSHFWNFQTNVKTGMPVSEDFWNKWPGELYHGTTEDRLESIMQHGLHPWDSPIAGGSNYEGGEAQWSQWLQPRPNHVYLSPNPFNAYNKAAAGAPWGGKIVVLKVDPRYLKPENINPDEDDMHYYVPGAPSIMTHSPEPPPELGGRSLGEYAEHEGWGTPEQTERSIIDKNTIAHRGVIPPEAITPGYVIPKLRIWEPISFPSKITSSNHLEWEPGSWGKGLYFPETGEIHIWGDDRTHSDVWFDDENFSQPGSAHHLVIRPNGTVEDQGAMNRNFEDTEADTIGLEEALKRYDPRLRLDTSDWAFGPTEPMEEEPSSISRGEEGGKDAPTVQTANDFAGSL